MSEKWTAGPWTVDGRLVRAPPRDDTEGRAHAVCRVISVLHPGTMGRAREMHAANALLIAAAPDLAVALDMLFDAFVVDNTAMTPYQQEAADRAHKALMKAEGRP